MIISTFFCHFLDDELWKDDKGRDCAWFEANDEEGCPHYGFDSFAPCSTGFCFREFVSWEATKVHTIYARPQIFLFSFQHMMHAAFASNFPIVKICSTGRC